MGEEYIKVILDDEKNFLTKPKVGTKTISLVNSFENIDDDGKAILISEAQDILSHCVFSGRNDCITNIAVGYVQSGKTMSFTVLTALAADNGFKMVIYLTGTKTNLQDQTYKRLCSDVRRIEDSSDYFKIIPDGKCSVPVIKDYVLDEDYTLLLPILKHYKHINALSDVLQNVEIEHLLDKKAVLIIDDEADQSSFNTYARQNSIKEDWEDDEYSKTYTSINNLKNSLPCHSYVQYTATPQAAFLINNNDILSPQYHTVLTEGKGYTGGKYFFKSDSRQYVIEIPDNEVYHSRRNPLTDKPESFDKALMQFFVSVAIVVRIQKRMDYLSMMVHIDGNTKSNEKFKRWTDDTISEWSQMFRDGSSDIAWSAFLSKVHAAYDEISKYVENKPSFEEVLDKMPKVLKNRQTYLIQGNSNEEIDWKSSCAHILVGADMLNRGFTVEHLSMTYMPRSPVGRATADTIEQRCRFFGYKEKYSDIIRIYLSRKSIGEFNAYVDHEEMLRTNLKQCKTLQEFAKQYKTMVMSPLLKPTRANILSSRLIRSKMNGWRQLRSLYKCNENKEKFEAFRRGIDNWVLDFDYKNPMRNHNVAKVPVETFISFFKGIVYSDLPNITRKIATIQYLDYLAENGKLSYVNVYDIACGNMRERKLDGDVPNNLQEGRAANGSYPGDKAVKIEDTICIQLHHILIKNKDISSVKYSDVTDLYNIAIYYPEGIGEDYISLDEEDEDA